MKKWGWSLILVLISLTKIATADATDSLIDHMKFLAKRDSVIASNIANIDTPNYLPLEVQKEDNQESNDFHIITTNSQHISVNSSENSFKISYAEIDELKPNGNGVNIEKELLKKNINALSMDESLLTYKKMREMIKTAINGGR